MRRPLPAAAPPRRPPPPRRRRGPETLIQVVVQVALLLAERVVVVLQLVDSPAQLAKVVLDFVQALRSLHLVGRDALHAPDAGIEVVQLDLYRVLFGRGAGAAGAEQRQQRERQGKSHDRHSCAYCLGAAAGAPAGIGVRYTISTRRFLAQAASS